LPLAARASSTPPAPGERPIPSTKANSAETRAAKKGGAAGEAVEIVKTIVYALLIALVIRVVLFQPYTIPSASMEPNLYQGDYIIVSKWSYGYSRHSIIFSPPIFKGRIFFTPPRRGDIIVFKLPRDGHTDYIKRLIGLPGDRMQMRGGSLYINGREVPERLVKTTVAHDRGLPEPVQWLEETNPEGRRYLIQIHGRSEVADNTGVYVVPPHCYFMMGDNRDNSADSRFDPGLPPEDPKLGGCGWDSRNDAALNYDTGVGFVPEDNLVGKAQIIILSWKEGASILKPWTWILDIRPGRFFRLLK
jgi:signal peptidase I